MIDIIFCAWHRPEYTAESLRMLAENTDWEMVRRLIIYTDGAPMTNGCVAPPPIPSRVLEYNQDRHGGPVAIMNDYLSGSPSEIFAKLDNDTVVPPGWLLSCTALMRHYHEVALLGIEPVYGAVSGSINREVVPVGHIGGIGLFQSSVFGVGLPTPAGRLGFTDWQVKHPEVVKAWIRPALPVILLDRLPFEPWISLGQQYESAGWQRPWKHYGPEDSAIWDWWRK